MINKKRPFFKIEIFLLILMLLFGVIAFVKPFGVYIIVFRIIAGTSFITRGVSLFKTNEIKNKIINYFSSALYILFGIFFIALNQIFNLLH